MLLGSHAVAGHGIPLVVVAVGRQRLAGKLLAWRCRADSGNVQREHALARLDGLSESSGSNRRAWQRCATRHPQARRNKSPPPAATADDSASSRRRASLER